MKRYHFLSKKDIYDALNELRNAFLAAKNGEDVDEIINGLLTQDEKMKIGRRIIIGQMLGDLTMAELVQISHVGRTTISLVSKLKESHPKCYQLINTRKQVVENEYERKKYKNVGGSTKIFKTKEYPTF